MRILEITWEYPPHVVGGLGSHAAALLPHLSALGHDVHVLTPRLMGGDALEVQDGVMIHRVEPPVMADDLLVHVQQANVALDGAAETLMARHGPFDVIHAHDWLDALASIGVKHRHNIPLVATIHATERGRGRGTLNGRVAHAIADTEWWLAFEAWRVIATSRFMASELQQYFAIPAHKIDVVPNGIETQPFDALDTLDLADFRARYARPDQAIVFSVGRLVHEKGIHLIVEAAPQIIAQHPQAKFVIAGTGPMADAMRARVRDLGLSEHVALVGFISNHARDCLYKVADCAVFPSLYEPFGIVALEAMAAKCPLIVASTGGLAEVVRHHETGLTVYPDSVDSLAYGILHMLKNPDWAHVRAMNAYHMVERDYNWRGVAERTAEVLQRVVGERQGVEW